VIFALIGSSGSGTTTYLNKLLEYYKDIAIPSHTVTTRKPRHGKDERQSSAKSNARNQKKTLRDKDGEYPFAVGDFFVFPLGICHEQRNTGKETFEAMFIRTK